MNRDETVTASGTVMFWWDSDDEEHLLLNIEPDDRLMPEAFELLGAVRKAALAELEEGAWIEIIYREEHHELINPSIASTQDSNRQQVLQVRIEQR